MQELAALADQMTRVRIISVGNDAPYIESITPDAIGRLQSGFTGLRSLSFPASNASSLYFISPQVTIFLFVLIFLNILLKY